MGIINRLIKRPETRAASQVEQYFKLMTAYAPAYSTYQGGLYEMALTRAAVHAYATHCGKLEPKVAGSARKDLAPILQYQPNEMMDTYTFLYKLATILKVENTAFIIPILSPIGKLIGFYPQRSEGTEIKSLNGVQYLFYPSPLNDSKKIPIELEFVGIMRNHFYKQNIYGDGNTAIDTTLNLMYTQDQGIVNGVTQSANIRFLAKLAQVLRPDDITAERKRFKADNLAIENNGGVMMFDQKYDTVQQIKSEQFLIDDKQTALIRQNVYEYFGVNEEILQNKFKEETWNAYYEGAIEPFAVQLSLVLSNLLFSAKEKAMGNMIILESNRLAYASNTTKISLVTQLFDRGFMTHNQGLGIFNMSPVDNGDEYYIRREYVEVSKLGDVVLDKEAPIAPKKEDINDNKG